MSIVKCLNPKCPSWDAVEPDNCSHPWKQMSECDEAILEKVIAKPRSFYFEELMSSECQCGEPKKPGYSFCYTCYKSLPRDLQIDLYSKIGDGYEQAYEASIKWLDEN